MMCSSSIYIPMTNLDNDKEKLGEDNKNTDRCKQIGGVYIQLEEQHTESQEIKLKMLPKKSPRRSGGLQATWLDTKMADQTI